MRGNKYTFHPKLVVRTPAMPYSNFRTVHLKDVLLERDFQDAVLQASTDLYKELDKCNFDFERLSAGLRLAAFKYYNRMSFRPTPFGAFATVGLLPWELAGEPLVRECSHQLISFADFSKLEATGSTCSEQARIYLNPSMYELGNEFRYLAREKKAKQLRADFQIMKISRTGLLKKLFRHTVGGVEYTSLVDFLEKDLGQTDGPALIKQFIDAQAFYHSELPVITADSFEAEKMERKEVGSCVVAFHTQKGGLSSNYQNDLLDGLYALDKLAHAAPIASLADFAAKFSARFESAEIPLLRALDPQSGISYLGTEKSAGQDENLMQVQGSSDQPVNIKWTAVGTLILQKIAALGGKSDPVCLSEAEISALPDPLAGATQYSPSLAVMFRPAGESIYIEHAGGNSAVNIAGRFSLKGEIREELKVITALEQQQNPEVVFAELAAMDNSITDNVNARGHLRDYEIPLLVHSSLEQNRIIALSDLTLQVISGRVILRSERLNKMVIPRLASAYNYRLSNLPLLRFLGDLQYQDLKWDLSFDAEYYVPGLAFYPRISYKNTILSPAKWIWDKAVLDGFTPDQKGLENFRARTSETGLPVLFSLAEADRELVVDLNCADSLNYFLAAVSGKKKVVLKEVFLPGPKGGIIDEKGSAHIGQFVAFALNKERVYRGLQPQVRKLSKENSVFLPGSDWLYFKIYAHRETLNMFLAEQSLFKFLSRLKKLGAIRCWFFVRYADTESHLRFRVKTDPRFAPLVYSGFADLVQKFMQNGLVSDFLIASYQPESARYALCGMQRAEKFFECSSELVLAFFKPGRSCAQEIGFALSSVNSILSVLLPDLAERLSFSSACSAGITGAAALSADKYYRRHRGELEQAANDPENYYGSVVTKKIDKLLAKCKQLRSAVPAVDAGYLQLAADLIHMHFNKLNASGSAGLEINTYYFLAKYYSSIVARASALQPA